LPEIPPSRTPYGQKTPPTLGKFDPPTRLAVGPAYVLTVSPTFSPAIRIFAPLDRATKPHP